MTRRTFGFLPHLLLLTIGTLAMNGCERQSAGFALPPGDVERGKVTFVKLGCNNCHRIADAIERKQDSPYPEVDVRLGGQVSRIKTYGELVTSIIHPAQDLSRGDTPALVDADGKSKMPYFNDTMTVQQLVDLTMFMQQTYTIYIPEYRPMFLP